MIAGSVLDLIGDTPLIRLRAASEATGCEILGKAEFLNPGQSVKDRAALWIIRDAEKRGALRKGGALWMVANMHLPYEGVLEPLFARVERRDDGGGYKVFEARKAELLKKSQDSLSGAKMRAEKLAGVVVKVKALAAVGTGEWMMIPVVIVFFLAQKRFIEGISAAGIKG